MIIDQKNSETIEALKKVLREGYKNLFIFGNVGVGKTYIAQNLIPHDYFIDEPTFKQHIVSNTAVMMPAGVDRTRTTLPNYPLEALATFPTVIYDDIGASDVTPAYIEKTLYWLNERAKSPNKRTIFTSNLTLEELEKRENRIYSRIMQDCTILDLDGPDRRLKNIKFV